MDINTMKNIDNSNLYQLFNSITWYVSQLTGAGVNYIAGKPRIRDHSTLLEWYLSNVSDIISGTDPIIIAEGTEVDNNEPYFETDSLSLKSEKTSFGMLVTLAVVSYRLSNTGKIEQTVVYHHYLLSE